MPAVQALDRELAARIVNGLADQAVLALDPAGVVLWGNGAVRTLLGRAPEEIAGSHVSAFYPADELELGIPGRELEEAAARGCIAREAWQPRPDGSRFWAYCETTALRDEQGAVIGFSRLVRDLDERVRTEETLRASEARFAGIIALATDAIVSADEELRIVLFNQAAEKTFGYSAAEVLGRPLHVLMPERFRAGHDAMMRSFASSPVRARRIGDRPEIVGLRRSGEEFPAEASISQLELGSRRLLTAVLRDVSDRRAWELEMTAALERERLLRARAEVSERRGRMLAEATRLLSDSLAPEETLAGIARLAAPELADCCAIHLMEGRHLSRSAFTHSDRVDVTAPDLSAGVPHPPAGVGGAMARALRSGEVQRVRGAHPVMEGDGVPAQDTLCVPVEARGHMLGLITLCHFREGAAFSADDVEIASELANHVALALDNAHLYREAEEARRAAEASRQWILRLQTVTAALSEATTPEEIAGAVLRHADALLGTHSGMIARIGSDGAWLEMVSPADYPVGPLAAFERFPVDASTPMGDAVRRREMVVMESAEAVVEAYPAVAETMRRMGSGSLVAAPLTLDGRVLGALGVGFAAPRKFTPAELEMVDAVARQCALALERARLFEQEHAARDRVERALRGRDEVLRVVAHDLGNSLSGVLTTSSALMRILGTRGDAEGMEVAGNIHGAAQQMHRLRRDLLDSAVIEAGQLSIVSAPQRPAELLEDAAAPLQHLAAEKEIHLGVDRAGDLPLVLADRDRILQVLTNLVVNAIRFTPAGGSVRLAAAEWGGAVRLSVRDTGPGVPAEHRTRVFESFWKTQGGGAGLGLAIARGIVQAHGGEMWLEDGPGEGAEFAFTLPRA